MKGRDAVGIVGLALGLLLPSLEGLQMLDNPFIAWACIFVALVLISYALWPYVSPFILAHPVLSAVIGTLVVGSLIGGTIWGSGVLGTPVPTSTPHSGNTQVIGDGSTGFQFNAPVNIQPFATPTLHVEKKPSFAMSEGFQTNAVLTISLLPSNPKARINYTSDSLIRVDLVGGLGAGMRPTTLGEGYFLVEGVSGQIAFNVITEKADDIEFSLQ
jgi:hypothetical protein